MPDRTGLLGQKIAVIGAGIGGLAVAVAAARRGAEVAVYEQAEALEEIGAGIQISPNGARVLVALGVAPIAFHASIQNNATVAMDGLTGAEIARMPHAKYDGQFRFFYRPELISILENSAREQGVTIHLGARVETDRTTQSFTLSDGATVDADFVVAADGLHSSVREMLNGRTKPRFSGQVAWRAIVPGTHPQEARVWMMPGRHVVTYPLGADRLNLVAIEETSEWAEEGHSIAGDPKVLRARFMPAAAEVQGHLAKVDEVCKWGLFLHPVVQRWHNARSHALIGDAAHPTLPSLGQGANLALEDAWTLVEALASDEPRAKALSAWQVARTARATRAVRMAATNARNFHRKGLSRRLGFGVLRGLDRVAPNTVLNRLKWLYDFDPTA